MFFRTSKFNDDHPHRVQPNVKFTGRPNFWDHVFAWDDPGSNRVIRLLTLTTGFSAVVTIVDLLTTAMTRHGIDLGIAVAPYEFAGAILGSLLVLRTNAGLDRWWEARKLWGSIINESRNLAILGLTYGPADPDWRRRYLGWVACLPHAMRRTLRNQRTVDEMAALVGADAAARVAASNHMPTHVSMMISRTLLEARDRGQMDSFMFLQAEQQRCLMIDYIGGCERIMKTPLAQAYIILIRRFIVLFLVTLPFALLRRIEWLTPFVTMLVAYPILSLDQIAEDLQQPFSRRSINHLPLDDFTAMIEGNVLGLGPEAEIDHLAASPQSPSIEVQDRS